MYFEFTMLACEAAPCWLVFEKIVVKIQQEMVCVTNWTLVLCENKCLCEHVSVGKVGWGFVCWTHAAGITSVIILLDGTGSAIPLLLLPCQQRTHSYIDQKQVVCHENGGKEECYSSQAQRDYNWGRLCLQADDEAAATSEVFQLFLFSNQYIQSKVQIKKTSSWST